MVKDPPVIAGDSGLNLGQEDPLEEEVAIYFSILVWEIPRTEKPGWLQSMESQRVRQDWDTEHSHTILPNREELSCKQLKIH